MVSSAAFLLCLGVLGSPRAQASCSLFTCPFDGAGSSDGTEAGSLILTPSAGTLGRGQGMIGLAMEHQRYNSFPADDAHELHMQGRHVHGKNHEETYSAHLGYGVTDRWDAFVSVPYVTRAAIQVEDHEMLGRGERSEGFGDLTLGTKYRLVDGPVAVAGFALVQPPTGETSERDQSGAEFDVEMQPGSGSWDFGGGVAVGGPLGKSWTWGAALQGLYRGEGAQQVKLGDVLRWDVGVATPRRRLGSAAVNAALELHGQAARRDQEPAGEILDSGGTTILFSPGVVAAFSETVSAFLSVPVPVYQNLGGEHEEFRYEIMTGVSWRF